MSNAETILSADRQRHLTVRRVLRTFIGTTAILAIFVGACSNSELNDDGSTLPFSVLYMTRGAAFAIVLADGSGQSRVIAELPAVRDDWSLAPDARILALPTDYIGNTEHPQLLLVDLASGKVESFTDSIGGNGAAAVGYDGAIALCDADGTLRAGNSTDKTSLAQLALGHPLQGCPSMAWRRDGLLAFVDAVPLGVRRNQPPDLRLDLYLYDGSSPPEPQNLARDVAGFGPLSWSADGTRLLTVDRGNARILDVANRELLKVGPQEFSILEAEFAPESSALVALYNHGDRTHELQIYRDDVLIESLTVRDQVVFDWCPDEEWIAVADRISVELWNWKTGDVRRVTHDNTGFGRIGASVACLDR